MVLRSIYILDGKKLEKSGAVSIEAIAERG